jgi:hypothetical protein
MSAQMKLKFSKEYPDFESLNQKLPITSLNLKFTDELQMNQLIIILRSFSSFLVQTMRPFLERKVTPIKYQQ